MSAIAVEFDGRMAAIAREETGCKYKTSWILVLIFTACFFPGRADGANSTHPVPPSLLPSCSSISTPSVESTASVI